jgi:TnpA family transposase
VVTSLDRDNGLAAGDVAAISGQRFGQARHGVDSHSCAKRYGTVLRWGILAALPTAGRYRSC